MKLDVRFIDKVSKSYRVTCVLAQDAKELDAEAGRLLAQARDATSAAVQRLATVKREREASRRGPSLRVVP